jgi:hypothetical protein
VTVSVFAAVSPAASLIAARIPPMPERNADVLEVLIGQMAEYRDVDLILNEALCVLHEAKFLQPIGNWLWRRRTHAANSSSSALASFRSLVSNPSVNHP